MTVKYYWVPTYNAGGEYPGSMLLEIQERLIEDMNRFFSGPSVHGNRIDVSFDPREKILIDSTRNPSTMAYELLGLIVIRAEERMVNL